MPTTIGIISPGDLFTALDLEILKRYIAVQVSIANAYSRGKRKNKRTNKQGNKGTKRIRSFVRLFPCSFVCPQGRGEGLILFPAPKNKDQPKSWPCFMIGGNS
jgi:hypothetical protein